MVVVSAIVGSAGDVSSIVMVVAASSPFVLFPASSVMIALNFAWSPFVHPVVPSKVAAFISIVYAAFP